MAKGCMRGTVKWFSDEKGYGFIQTEARREYFVHHTGILAEGYRSLEAGQKVEFQLEESKRTGRPTAVMVTVYA